MGFNADASRIALPRGKVFFARKNLTTGVLDPLIHLGNCSKLEFGTIGDDIAEILDFTSFSPTPLTRISKKRAPEFPITLMECNPDNLKLVFMGDAGAAFTQASGGSATAEALAGGAKIGAIYKLAKRGSVVSGVGISAMTIKKAGAALSAQSDFTIVDAINGIIQCVAMTSTGLVAGDALTADYTYPVITTPLNVVLGGYVPRIEGQLLYVGTSNVGPVHQLDIWNCSIASDGAYPFIASDPVEFGLKVTVLTAAGHTELFTVTELELS